MTNLFQNIKDYYEGGDLHVRGLVDDCLPDNIKHVSGNLVIHNCPNLKTLNIESVDGNIDIQECPSLESLGELKTVGGFILIWDCANFTCIGDKLSDVHNNLTINKCPKFSDLNGLKYVNGYCDFEDCPSLSNIDGMVSVEHEIYIKGTNIKKSKFSNQFKL